MTATDSYIKISFKKIKSIIRKYHKKDFISFFSSCKADRVDVRSWLEDILRRLPTEKAIDQLLPCNWQVLPANSR